MPLLHQMIYTVQSVLLYRCEMNTEDAQRLYNYTKFERISVLEV
jgi:hypothetical protein